VSDQVVLVATGAHVALSVTAMVGLGLADGDAAIEQGSDWQTIVKFGAVPVIEKLAQLGSL
jgi:hypothetical protein